MKTIYVLLWEDWNGECYSSSYLEFAGWTKEEADAAAAKAREMKVVKSADVRVTVMDLEMPDEPKGRE